MNSMDSHAETVKDGDEVANSQTTDTVPRESKIAMDAGSEKGLKEDLQHQNTLPGDVNPASEKHALNFQTTIQDLPPEMMTEIFSKLSGQDRAGAACVCSSWSKLIDKPCVWKDFFTTLNLDTLTPEHIEKMQIRKIEYGEVVVCSDMKKMTEFLQALPLLKHLFLLTVPLSHLDPGDDDVPGLVFLGIRTYTLCTDVLQSLLRPMVNLEDLLLICTPDPNILIAINHLKCLKYLCIYSWSIVHLEIQQSDNLKPMPSMRELVLVNMTMGDTGLELMCTNFPHLETLELTLLPDVTSKGLTTLAKLKELRHLRLESWDFNDDWLDTLETLLSKLESFNLHGCSSIPVKCLELIAKMPVLNFLQVPIQHVEINGLYALSQGCPSLETLHLTSGDSTINDILHIVNYMPNLQTLILEDCAVKDDFWENYSRTFKNLKVLTLSNCQHLSEHCLHHVSQMTCLEKLLLIKCKTIGNQRMSILRKREGFKSLISLTLMELVINNEGLAELSLNIPSLIKLTVVSCSQVNEDGLIAAVSILRNLQFLKANITAETKYELERIRPNLRFYTV